MIAVRADRVCGEHTPNLEVWVSKEVFGQSVGTSHQGAEQIDFVQWTLEQKIIPIGKTYARCVRDTGSQNR